MKIDRQEQHDDWRSVKPGFTQRGRIVAIGFFLAVCASTPCFSKNPSPSDPSPSDPNAIALVDQVIDRLANGPAFYAKVRQRIRTAGREVIGVGSYLQVGGGTGQFKMHVDVHDGDGKHTLHQISDGRLAWTRSEIAGVVSLSRVDLLWLDEGARALNRNDRVKPSMKVGGLSEMLDSIRRDYDLKLGTSSLAGQPLLVIIGSLKQSRREQIEAMLGEAPWPILFPTRVNVAITQADDPESGFGKGLPIRIEHLSDPVALSKDRKKNVDSQLKSRQMISLLEFYSIQPTKLPPIEHFRFENQDTEIDFVNLTSRYEERFDIRVSAKERERTRYR